MKKIYSVIITVLMLWSLNACNQDNKTIHVSKEIHPISKAYGYENWEDIKKVSFVFNVEKEKSFKERSWIWFPKIDSVISISLTDTLGYNRKSELNPLEVEADKMFINDRFWAFFPFNLTWDEGITFSEMKKEKAPISKIEMNKQTILYGSEGGYTPGDAYDVYFDDNYLIKEWVFRRGNSKEPSIINSWSGNKTQKGIVVSTEHFNADSSFHLFISDLKLE